MRQTIYILLSFVLIAGVSCSKKDGGEPRKGAEVSFSPTLSPFDQSSDKFEMFDKDFSNGDEVSVFALQKQNGQLYDSGNYADNVRYVYRNGRLVAQNSPIYLPSGNKGLEYYGVYPYGSGVRNHMTFSVKEDQLSEKNYKLSDLRTAYTSETNSASPRLDFYHSLSQVCVNVDNGYVRQKDFVFYLTVKTKSDVNVTADTYQATGSRNQVKMMYDSSTDLHYAVIPPQWFEKSDIFIYFDYDGINYETEFFNKVDFLSGYQTYLNISFEKTDDGTYRAILLDGQIRPWENDVADR